MKKIKESRKTRYTRMALQNSLLELMEKKPITKITIKELCDNADINRTTFYAHYANQHDLLREIEDETFSWVEESLTSLINKTDQYESMEVLEGIFQHFVENRKHLQILMSEQGNIDFQKQLLTLIYQQCNISLLTMTYTSMNILEDYFVFVVSGSIGLIQHWFKNGLNKSAKEMAEIIYKMAASPISLVELQRNSN